MPTQPKVGDTVSFVQADGVDPWPAVVTAVEPDGKLSLLVTKPSGEVLPKEHVPSGSTGRRWTA